MTWNWEHPDWPGFVFDAKALDAMENTLLLESGAFVGAFRHIGPDDQTSLRIELTSDEAVRTSAIEGEILNRDSVQSSLAASTGPRGRQLTPQRAGLFGLVTADLAEGPCHADVQHLASASVIRH